MEGRWQSRKFCSVKCAARHRYKNNALNKSMIYRRSESVNPLGKNCEMCGATESLDRHHKDENPLNNEPSNVMTLCDACHTKLHWATGKKAKPKTLCVVCGAAAKGRGYCLKHFQRFKKYGDPLLKKKSLGLGKFVLVPVSSND
jgi:uncharacterized protein YlaI